MKPDTARIGAAPAEPQEATMPTSVTRGEVQHLIAEQAAQLVEVLPRAEYDEEHLPDALHLPLKELNPDTAQMLDRQRPIIVYCFDAL
jgi:rhodanese-related sulfurtransferase